MDTFKEAVQKLRACNSMDELREAWHIHINEWSKGFSYSECQELIWVKDEIKFKIARGNPGLPVLNKNTVDDRVEPRACYSCGSNKYWRIKGGDNWLCAQCHPPANESGIEKLTIEGNPR
jgi:hypothetical protein